MKTLSLLVMTSLLLAQVARAEDDARWKRKATNASASTQTSTQAAPPKPVTPPVQQNRWSGVKAPSLANQTLPQQKLEYVNALRQQRVLRDARGDNTTNSGINFDAANANIRSRGQAGVGNRHHDDAASLTNFKQPSGYDEQTRAELRAWRGKTASYEEARRAYTREHHDRDWWRSHHRVIILIGGGYYYWNAGWWYPAWGYDPYYSSYDYDGPILGYDGLPPDQVIARVQTQLQDAGYFPYAVDGVFGPATRAALANFQRDSGLYVTGVIDPPTMRQLGFIY